CFLFQRNILEAFSVAYLTSIQLLSWCWEISLSEVFLIEVVATGFVAPSIFHLKR
ncbi:hypothetical protein Golax_023062, partial [Gossypium laxum]|nr:hypothetical protein [Gossypium laxum]